MRVDFLKILFALTLTIAGILPAMAEEAGVHRFATFNVRFTNNTEDTGDRLWANRKKAVTDIVKDYDLDIVGMQEVTGTKPNGASTSQLQDLKSLLSNYSSYDVEREGKGYSYNCIFYKKNKYTVVDKGLWYINSHPSTPGNTWDYFGDANTIARTLAWIRFRDNDSKQEFYFAVTHKNYSKASNGVYGAELNVRMLSELVGQMPVVLVGDFNMHRSDENTYRHYRSQFYDAALTVPSSCHPYGNFTHTTNDWYPATSSNCKGNEFDYHFYDHITALEHVIITEHYGRSVTPSDHFPVMVRYKFNTTTAPTRFYASNTSELMTAVSKATQQDTICLAAGEYILNETITPTVSLTIVGGYDKNFKDIVGTSTLRQSEAKQIINIPQYYSLTLHNLNLENGYTESAVGGGLLAINGAKLNLYNCRFSNSISTTNAGAVYANAHDIHIENCVFENDSAKNLGGALYAQAMEKLVIKDCKFLNNGSATGAALYVAGGRVLDIQCNSFANNISNKQGALTIDVTGAQTSLAIKADKYITAAHLVNNSFLNNQLYAKKGIAAATKEFGGAAIYAKVWDKDNIQHVFNIAHCSFIGNNTDFTGLKANFAGGALRVAQGKACLMNNLMLANAEKCSDTECSYVDYTVGSTVNLWKNANNLYSNDDRIKGWESGLANTIAGAWNDKLFTATVLDNGTYLLRSSYLNNFNLGYIPTNYRLCESSFTYDIDGNGNMSDYLKYDQIHNARAKSTCVGAMEYKEGVTSVTELQPQNGIQRVGEHQYIVIGAPNVIVYNLAGHCVLSSSNETIDLSPLPSGLYIVNQHKIIR